MKLSYNISGSDIVSVIGYPLNSTVSKATYRI